MKKLSVVLASLVIFAGMTFANTIKQQSTPAPKTTKTTTTPVKKVPAAKNKAVPMVKKTTPATKAAK